MASTITSNPGPGRYDGESSMKAAMKNGVRSVCVKHGMQRAKSVTQILDSIPRQYNPPAIPQKMQTFGYISDNSKGFREVKPVNPPKQMIMGVGNDTVGPGAYEQFVGKGISGGELPSSFASSTTQRKVFEYVRTNENRMPDSDNPGPGFYEGKGFSWNKGSSAAFRSNVKMAHQISTRASKNFSIGKDFETGSISADGGMSDGDSVANFGKYGERAAGLQHSQSLKNVSSVQSFGSTARRDTCPRVHDKAVPFASRANLFSERLIGPGSYNNVQSSFSLKKQKSLRSVPVGFNGTAERPCLKKEDNRISLSAPGPGPIYNPEYLTLAHQVQKKTSGSRKIGVFGTTGPRFRPKNEIEEETDRTEFNVGPGSYEHEPEKVLIVKPKYTSAFKRDSFGAGGVPGGSFLGNQQASGGGFMVHGHNANADQLPDFATKDDENIADLQKRKVRPAFGSSEKRGGEGKNIDGVKFSDSPGPQYMSKMGNIVPAAKILVNGGRARYGGKCTFGKDTRKFETGNTGPEAIGPGSYKLPGSIKSQSFNITMKTKNKKYIRKSELMAMKATEKRQRVEEESNAELSITV